MKIFKNIFSKIDQYRIAAASSLLMASTLIFLSSCEETVHLDLNQTQAKIVIEGLVTDHPGYQMVKVSRTGDFYASGNTPRVTNAVVTVTDDAGNVYDFIHNPNNNSDSSGIYLPLTPFVGVVGRNYKLKVQVDGNLYQAEDHLYAIAKIDSLGYHVNLNEKRNPKVKDRFYNTLLFTQEPRNEKNYYYFKFFRNDSLKYNSDTDVYFSDDEFLAGNIDGVESPVFYSLGDKAKLEMYSISRVGYVYFSDLSTLLNNDAGGMFGPIPASPRTNLTNGALGFFQVSALDSKEVKIE